MSNLEINHLGVAMNIVNGRPLTDDLLNEVLVIISSIDTNISKEQITSLKKQLEHNIGIKMSSGEVIHADDHIPWVEDAKAKISWDYWKSYTQLLISEGWTKEVVDVLNEDTDKVLTECGNPLLTDGWKHRGLVMGDVQSGKTANYSGLIAKAADAGYKVIVLLTGLIEELRKQTQERMDEGFVGRNSRDVLGVNQNMDPIGVGKYRNKFANVLTSLDSDFLTSNSRALRGIPLSNISEPVLFVIKKNKSPLENLNKWLSQQLPASLTEHDLPLLIIDDEADNASVNTKKDEDDPATINRLIRDLLSKFSRSTYVAFTATPFANVFINPENEKDLFPSNFIYSLNSPSNYIGAESIFSEEGKHYSQLRIITDIELPIPESHNKDHELDDIPQSMKDAVKVFMLTCAIRDIRKEKLKHRTMLINVSRFNDVQAQIAEYLRQYLTDLNEEILQYLLSTSWSTHPKLIDLKNIWENEFHNSGVSWDELRSELHKSTASIKVVKVNQKSDEKLNYSEYKNTEKGRRVIAIGGLALSRGLTLYGLCVSYFYRNSKAYDTLLQMGRWFGYRPGYDDLFRIWMDNDAIDRFAHISTAVSELRTDFRRMSANRLSPDKFGIRVQSHPDLLIVTALNKMRNSSEIVHQISFSGFDAETPFLNKNLNLNTENVLIADSFAKTLGLAREVGRKYLWEKVDKQLVYEFISKLNISEMNFKFIVDSKSKTKPLVDFIGQNNIEKLSKWDICIPQGIGAEVGNFVQNLSDITSNIKCQNRKFEVVAKNVNYLKVNKQKVGDTGDEKVGMSVGEIESAENAWLKELEKDPTKGKTTPAYMYRLFRSRPLLTIHFVGLSNVEPDDKNMMLPADIESKVVVAISLSFPDFEELGKDNPNSKVVYRLNKIAMAELFGSNDEDEEDED
ncbi:Z1 domain-containing protein [Methylotenera versatilis]|uniref:Z1 domain-containing protein n=1 Tax=Methylotenera versatilis TaxID=1055487 RepID=UPI0006462AC1|nr:Z1 domain-containing protein [Methylotenera versatilis]